MKSKKLYEANQWWNDWKIQLHRNKLEWVNPRSTTEEADVDEAIPIYIQR